jgi:ADP-heptose:LPS heptosyltransferase
MFRAVSLYFRRRAERKNVRSVLDTRKLWEKELQGLSEIHVKAGTLAVIRLDDIGDYLLYRNFLQEYRQGIWAGYEITLIGNQAWRSLLEQFDPLAVDHTIWIDKHRYFGEERYRAVLWQQLRHAGFEVMICPSRTRPLLIDDLLVLAAGAPVRYAASNTYVVPEWNMISDGIYSRLFSEAINVHEFVFNRHFSNWVNERSNTLDSPVLPLVPAPATQQVVCFIGASAKSKRWPERYWIRLVQLLQQQGLQPVIAGGTQEEEAASAIHAATGVPSLAGKTSLRETLNIIGSARAVISGDTMAAHAAVASHKPAVILANGVNAQRFVAYESLQVTRVRTVYTRAYLQYRDSGRQYPFTAVSSDMLSIKPEMVVRTLLDLL